jgi:hypothetical protein
VTLAIKRCVGWQRIRLGDDDGNPRTAGDSTWTPLVVTPPYPDYTSGANSITGAATRALAQFWFANYPVLWNKVL